MKKLLLILALVALSSADIQSDSLALHNNERNNYGVPSVTWSASLAASAQAYAETMASTGTTSHSTNRVNVGENLAWGSGSSISVTSLGDLWIAEKKYYIPGQDFPDVSTTGSWHDVAHYTQLMWELTTEIGCGIAQGNGRYNLVCHYSPQGNIDGEPVYTVGAAPISSSSSSSPSSSSTGSTSTQPTTGTTNPQNNNNNNWNNNNNGNNNYNNNNDNNNNNNSGPSSSSSSTTSQPTTTSQPSSSSSSASTSAPNASSSQFITDCLNGHNTERNNYGIPSLVWDSSLASTAQSYAQVMAQTGTTSHSTNRVDVGENLAWGTGRSVTTTFLIGLWLAEKQFYVPGTDFPYVSTTGSWHDVAHYTQMMWEQTTAVGCGIAQASSGRYNLVCHYYVQGNIDGEPVYTVGVSPISSSSSSSSSSPSSSSSTGGTSTQPATNTTSTTSPANSTTTAPANTTTTTPQTNTTVTAPANTTSTTTPAQSQFITDCLNGHNTERNNYGVPSLVWDASLASTAQTYAQVMAQTGTTSHSTNRVNVGENLAWGTGSRISTTFLIGLWLAEKQYYIPGQDFPDVSTTGSWHTVAHYTQMMWEQTTAVGCGIAQASSGRYNLVCHYYVQGNIDGEPVYTVGASPISSSSSSSSPSSSSSSSSSSPSSSSSTGSTSTQPATGTTSTAPQTNSTSTTTGTSTSQPSSSSSPYTYSTSAPDASSSSFESDSLNAHNAARNAYGVPSLTWSTSLAQTAQSYSQVMASTGTTSHSTGRVDVGENLAWQSGSGTTTLALVNRWLAEKQYYIAGQDFPNVSTTGNWESVAHYTQMMWRQTTQVGCGVSEGGNGMYYYVCHYYVQGNIMGQPVY